MANHEKKDYADAVDLYLALSRTKDKQEAKCFRVVIKDSELDLKLLEYKCKLLGGKWRIHKTVNKRDTKKALKWLQHKLLDFPEGAGFVDSLWRTALLQSECAYGEKRFLLDIDTKDPEKIIIVKNKIREGTDGVTSYESVETENGWHYITDPFDTREVCKLDYVELIRDGYHYVTTVNGE